MARPIKVPKGGAYLHIKDDALDKARSLPTVTEFLREQAERIAAELNAKYPKNTDEANDLFIANVQQGSGDKRSRASVHTGNPHGYHVASKYRALDVAMANERED